MPSFLLMVMSAPLSPIVTTVSRFVLVVRSGLITVHESPRSVLLNRRLPATYSTPGSLGESITGVSHMKRKVSSFFGAGVTFSAFGRIDLDSPVTLLRRIRLPSCDSVYTMRESRRSCTAWKPSPPWIWKNSWL